MRQPNRKRAVIIGLVCVIALLCIISGKQSSADKSATETSEAAASAQDGQAVDEETKSNSDNTSLQTGTDQKDNMADGQTPEKSTSDNDATDWKADPVVTKDGIELPEMELVDSGSDQSRSQSQDSGSKAATEKDAGQNKDSAAGTETESKSESEKKQIDQPSAAKETSSGKNSGKQSEAAKDPSQDKESGKQSTTAKENDSKKDDEKSASGSDKAATDNNQKTDQDKMSSTEEETASTGEPVQNTGKRTSQGIELPVIHLD